MSRSLVSAITILHILGVLTLTSHARAEDVLPEASLADDEGFGVTLADGSELPVAITASPSGEESESDASNDAVGGDLPILRWSDGIDNRLPWDSYESPRTKIGAWVHRGAQSTYCTGALVGSRVVLTAAHCMYDSQGQRDDALFSAGHNRKVDPLGLYEVHSVFRNNGFINQRCFDLSKPSFYCIARDYAVVVLQRSPGLGSFGTAAAPSDAEFATYYMITAGYPADRGGTLYRDEPCSAGGTRRNGDYMLFAHACDIGGGQSGSPVWTPKHPRARGNVIVGIATAGGDCLAPACRDRFDSQGVRISSQLFGLIQEVKAKYP